MVRGEVIEGATEHALAAVGFRGDEQGTPVPWEGSEQLIDPGDDPDIFVVADSLIDPDRSDREVRNWFQVTHQFMRTD